MSKCKNFEGLGFKGLSDVQNRAAQTPMYSEYVHCQRTVALMFNSWLMSLS